MHVAKLKQVSVDHPPSVCNVKTLAAAVLWRLTEYTRYNLSYRINVRKKCGRDRLTNGETIRTDTNPTRRRFLLEAASINGIVS